MIGGLGNLLDAAIHFNHHPHNSLEGTVQAGHGLRALGCVRAGGTDAAGCLFGLVGDAAYQFGNLAGGLGGAFGKAPHFAGHDGKSAAMLTGAGGLNGGIEGQEVGSGGDLFDDADNGADLFGVLAEGCDAGHALLGIPSEPLNILYRRVDQLAAFAGGIGGRARLF